MAYLPSFFESRSRVPSFFRRNLLADVENMMNEAFRDFGTEIIPNGGRFAVDVEEQQDKYVVEAELPGVDKKDVNVTLHDRSLTIQINQSGEKEKKEKTYVCKERWTGSSARTIALPEAGSDEGVEAALKDGVLHVTVRKQPNVKTKRISVQ